ncbi:methyltransferase family protein [Roseibium hamelinense]|uniref:Methyltransferase family protein n=1 Tax=Roseibium hamelinense TaxID=150831 RepID=A0A562T7W8_9HYPH|nr:methyltransferase domain-containing protein [Roseibium hamelinense]MTI43684.1 methyltransferase domain-containing protein [Roseibium hamelinense]TWI89363.1 methyltransferase family protein [Roseibium hamelinense]
MPSNFVLGPHYTNVITTAEEVRTWAEETAKLPVEERIGEMRRTFYQAPFEPFWDMDPASNMYRGAVMDLYETVYGQPYSLEFEPEAAGSRDFDRPFPFDSGSNTQIGENLIGVGGVLKHIPAPPGARVLDMGCGWANTSLTLARAGYHVTATDIDPGCGDLINHWAPRLAIEDLITFQACAFEDTLDTLDGVEPFDVILFFKSFHHCLYPQKLLDCCHKLLKPGGHVFLAAEPIHGNFYVPWGLRCDGTSIFMIAQKGWLELGYDEAYFGEMMGQNGFEFAGQKKSLEIPTMNHLLYRKI